MTLKKWKHPTASCGFEGVSGSVVEAGISKDGQGAHSGEDNKDPEEHTVHYHGNILPVLLQLDMVGGRDNRGKEGEK